MTVGDSDAPAPKPADPKTIEKTDDLPVKEDPYLDRAVDEIVHGESDQLLKAKDEELEHAFEPHKSRWERIRAWWGGVWAEPKYRYGILSGSISLIVVLMLIPVTRWGIMNTLGFRASASLKITDDKTTQPIKNAAVSLAGKSVKTDDNGIAKFDHLKLGPTQLKVKKTAYTELSQSIRVGLGSNILSDRSLSAVGARLKFNVSDWLSKMPVKKAEATIGDSSAFANDEGLIEIPVDPTDAILDVSISAEHYKASKLSTTLAETATKDVSLVTDYPNYFLSNRDGKFDLYRVDVDGLNEKQVLAGTGRESGSDMQLSMSPSHQYAALVSKRDNDKNTDGYLKDSLNIFDTKTDSARKITSSEDIYLVAWDANHLVYVKVAAGASAANKQRQRLMSYDLTTNQERELASSNYFVNAVAIKDYIYYMPSDAYAGSQRGIYRSRTDGSDKLAIYTDETWAVYRNDWDTLIFQTPKNWYRYVVNKSTPEKLDAAPSNTRNVVFADNSDHTKTVWLDERDGKGTLLIRSTSDKKDAILRQQSGLKSVVGWMGDKYVIYRVATPAETADYIISTDGGNPAKIKDVFNVDGIKPAY